VTDNTITIEVDGKPLQARKGQMLIEVTDANDIYVPRFCYHSKLTIAANCRMCLVQVEKAPKPLPACATPVMEGMKVSTNSAYARDAQKAVMEFLLINHPLDCPICDQGGECELQDLAMGYGSDVSRYQEKKRVVKDKNIGPLVQTEMTRCIHCTRCVRFGEEIAGLRELGATGRSEHMEIGTYIEKSMVSELSGNVIDLCPVGALTDKPFRFTARTWEMTQHPGIAPHDGTGSNLHFHVKRDKVMRVVPAQNEAVNEVWLSDRDRYSYSGLYSSDRLQAPMIKENGAWIETDWETAFDRVREKLLNVISSDPHQLGALLSAGATTEEAWLLQKILRNAGSNNIDHRIHQSDFSDQENDPACPSLGLPIAELEQQDAVLLVGANPRKQQPLLNLRLRKAALKGAEVMAVNPLDFDFNYRLGEKIIVSPAALARELAGILKALQEGSGNSKDSLLDPVVVNELHRTIAKKLTTGDKSIILLGNTALAHPQYSIIRYLAGQIAGLTSSRFGSLGESANDAGLWLAGAVPHRGPAAARIESPGLDARTMLENPLSAYLLFNIEPDLDCWNGNQAMQALDAAGTVVALTPYKSAALEQVADVLLPIAIYAENEGSYINIEGRLQSFAACIPAQGEARPAWKILRVLANKLGVPACDFESMDQIQKEISGIMPGSESGSDWKKPESIPVMNGAITRISDLPMNSLDSLVRRAPALQQTNDVADGAAHLSKDMISRLGLTEGNKVRVQQGQVTLELAYELDDRVPDNTILIHAAHPSVTGLGGWFSDIIIEKV